MKTDMQNQSKNADEIRMTTEEMAEARRWVAAKFAGLVAPPQVGLLVVANNGPVHKNDIKGKPLRIGGKQNARGLSCRALSKITVSLPGPAKTFSAMAGVDCDKNYGWQANPVSVNVGGLQRFRQTVCAGRPGVPVDVELDGAREFTLYVENSEKRLSCGADQVDWADACVTLNDGKTLWLDDLPVAQGRNPSTAEPPFSFAYCGEPFVGLMGNWALKRATRRLDENRAEHAVAWNDPETGLAVRCMAIEYHDFPVVEWTVYLKNTGASQTPIISDLQALDAGFERCSAGNDPFVLHHQLGTTNSPSDFQPMRTFLDPGAKTRIAPVGARPTGTDLPYFNLEMPGHGVIVVVGWPGQWAAQFTADKAGDLRVRAGQELTHFRLYPGEEVRSPLVVLQCWQGDRIRAQNIWRRWMLAHNLPRPNGRTLAPMSGACDGNDFPGMLTNAKGEKEYIDRYLEEGIRPDFWWIDAGWYSIPSGYDDWTQTGTWEADKKRYPNGLREVSDYARAKGMKTIAWFEPERVTRGTWLEKHPEWLFAESDEGDPHGVPNDGRRQYSGDLAYGRRLDLGNPEAWNWLVNHIDQLLTEEGIDVYRQDYNWEGPLGSWRRNDPEDRQGITEIKYVMGYLAYFDELLRRHPDMPFIDTCAGGGQRMDLETLRRAVPLWRCDGADVSDVRQCQTYGLSFWVPYHGTGIAGDGQYTARSDMVPFLALMWNMKDKALNYPMLRRIMAEWRETAACCLGDYYPLTPYSLGDDAWMAWQFDCPEKGAGMMQVFRRANSPFESARFQLKGLVPGARYTVKNLDVEGAVEMTGKELMEQGLPVILSNRPKAAIYKYELKK